jgi:hypothetical protein
MGLRQIWGTRLDVGNLHQEFCGGCLLAGGELRDVLGADLVGGKEAEEGRTGSSRFDSRAAVGFLAFDDANHSGYDHLCLARGFDGINR